MNAFFRIPLLLAVAAGVAGSVPAIAADGLPGAAGPASARQAVALAGGPVVSLSGLIEVDRARIALRDTLLLPNPAAAGWREWQNSGLLLLRSGLSSGHLTVAAQHRAISRSGGPVSGELRAGERLQTDELYAEYAWGERLFVHAGRRHLAMGQSLGINPSDVFFDRLAVNRRLPADRQRSETKGIDMVGFQYLTVGGSALSGFWAPATGWLNRGEQDDRWMLSYRTRLGAGMTDLTPSAFGGARPGVSVSIVHQTAQDWLFYTDAALRRGRALQTVSAPDGSGAFVLRPRQDDPWLTEATLGTGYTFGNGVAFNLELTHLAGGMDSAEWFDFVAAAAANSPPASPLAAQRLASLRALANHPELRRNYLFLRLFHERLAGSKLQGQLVVLHGLDDGSGSAALRFEYPVTAETSAWLYLNRRYGGAGDEFLQRTEQGTVSLGLVHRF